MGTEDATPTIQKFTLEIGLRKQRLRGPGGKGRVVKTVSLAPRPPPADPLVCGPGQARPECASSTNKQRRVRPQTSLRSYGPDAVMTNRPRAGPAGGGGLRSWVYSTGHAGAPGAHPPERGDQTPRPHSCLGPLGATLDRGRMCLGVGDRVLFYRVPHRTDVFLRSAGHPLST